VTQTQSTKKWDDRQKMTFNETNLVKFSLEGL